MCSILFSAVRFRVLQLFLGKVKCQNYLLTTPEHICQIKTGHFWKTWKQIHACSKTTNVTHIEGLICDDEIADCFSNSFKTVSSSNDPISTSRLEMKYNHIFSSYSNEHCDNDISSYFLDCASLGKYPFFASFSWL